MAYRFEAAHIFARDDGFVVTIGFVDSNTSPSQYLILQRQHKYDEQEERLGMDKIYIEIEDQSRSVYGGIKTISVEKNEFSFGLDSDASEALHIDGVIDIEVAAHVNDMQEVVEKLKRVVEEL